MGEGGLFYSPKRSIPAEIRYGNTRHRLQDDKEDLPAKMHLDGLQGWFGQTSGSAGPRAPPLTPPFVLDTTRWAPILCMSVPGLCTSVFLVKWAHLASVMQDEVFCVFMLRLMLFFPLIPSMGACKPKITKTCGIG